MTENMESSCQFVSLGFLYMMRWATVAESRSGAGGNERPPLARSPDRRPVVVITGKGQVHTRWRRSLVDTTLSACGIRIQYSMV